MRKKKYGLNIPLLYGLLLFTGFEQNLYALSLDLSTNFIHINNEDFQNYDDSKYIQNRSSDSLNTDDRASILYGNLALRFDTQYKNTKFFLDISRQGYWGTDNFQGRDSGQNPILMNRLYFIYYPFQSLSIHFGRHRYEVGDTGTDFFFSDVIDGIQINYQANEIVKLNFLTDIVALAFRPDNAGIFSVVQKDDEQLEDFRGDTVTFRVGSYLNLKISNAFQVKPFAYYLRYGGSTEGGADLSENGRSTLNRADNDFLAMGGTRLFGDMSEFGEYDLTIAYSYGRDHQFDDERTYNGLGTAINYSYDSSFLERLYLISKVSLAYFHQDFASMKARSPGGILLWGIKGYHAAPYAYFYHFRDYGKRKDSITWIDRTNAKTFLLFDQGISYDNWQASVHFLVLLETKSRELANKMFSYMGTEIEFTFSYRIDNIKLTLRPTIYVPSKYYLERIEISNSLPSGKDTFYAILFNTSYVLDLDFITASRKEPAEPKDKSKELLDEDEEAIE